MRDPLQIAMIGAAILVIAVGALLFQRKRDRDRAESARRIRLKRQARATTAHQATPATPPQQPTETCLERHDTDDEATLPLELADKTRSTETETSAEGVAPRIGDPGIHEPSRSPRDLDSASHSEPVASVILKADDIGTRRGAIEIFDPHREILVVEQDGSSQDVRCFRAGFVASLNGELWSNLVCADLESESFYYQVLDPPLFRRMIAEHFGQDPSAFEDWLVDRGSQFPSITSLPDATDLQRDRLVRKIADAARKLDVVQSGELRQVGISEGLVELYFGVRP